MKLYKKHVSDLGKVITGKTPRTSILENYGGKIPFLTPSDNMSEKFSPTTSKTLTKIGLNEVKNCLLPSKSICVSCIGSDLGKVVLTKKPTVTNQQFNSIVPNEENDADFIYYLMTVVGKHLNYLSKTSTAVPIINKSTFANYEIEIPNIKEQKRIGKILSSLDDKIELNRRINDNLILTNQNTTYKDDISFNVLVKQTLEHLIEQTGKEIVGLSELCRRISTVAQSIAEIRNNAGFASHGLDVLHPQIDKSLSLLIYKTTDVLCGFILHFYFSYAHHANQHQRLFTT